MIKWQAPVLPVGLTPQNVANWIAAFGWGNHAAAGYASASGLSAHVASVSNPHGVSKAQVGLGSVSNDAQLRANQLVTVVGTTGSDSAVPSERAVRAEADLLAAFVLMGG